MMLFTEALGLAIGAVCRLLEKGTIDGKAVSLNPQTYRVEVQDAMHLASDKLIRITWVSNEGRRCGTHVPFDCTDMSDPLWAGWVKRVEGTLK